MALALYRQLLRSTRIAFSGTIAFSLSSSASHRYLQLIGDLPTLTAARLAAREGFESNRSIPAEELPNALQHAKDVALLLRQNVVQGKLDEGGERYKLNIHEEIERGDNDSVKNPPPMIEGRGRNRLRGGKCGTI